MILAVLAFLVVGQFVVFGTPFYSFVSKCRLAAKYPIGMKYSIGMNGEESEK